MIPRVDRRSSALLIVDVQERMLPAVADGEQTVKNVLVLIEMCRRLGVPVVLSEHYPKGLGPTVAPIREALAAPGLDLHRIEKIEFPVTGNATFAEIERAVGERTWILVGMEAHVCVFQTARDLAERGRPVHVVADAVASRSRVNRDLGIGLAARAGAFATCTETVIFDALGRAGTDDFKALSRLIR